jgi:hypothetical protein
MSNPFQELSGIYGVEGYAVFDNAKNQMIQSEMPGTIDIKNIKQFIGTYLQKQQATMDLIANTVIFHGTTDSIALCRHNSVFLSVLLKTDADFQMILDKVKELWMRFDLGV